MRRLLMRLFGIKPQDKKEISQPESIPNDVFVPSLNLDGTFIKEKEFEEAWISENVKYDKRAKYHFNDEDFLDYKIWEDMNFWKLHYIHTPDTNVFRGDNNIIEFHGGCLGCKSQEYNSIDTCKGCKYFKFTDKPDLSIYE